MSVDWHDVETGEGLPAEALEQPAPRPRPETATFTAPSTDEACQFERARVLRHPEIAARLCQPPLNYSRPEVWQGFIPPETWRERANNSPQRAALLGIITAAVEADRELKESDA